MKRKNNRTLLIVIIVLLLIAVLVGIGLWTSGSASAPEESVGNNGDSLPDSEPSIPAAPTGDEVNDALPSESVQSTENKSEQPIEQETNNSLIDNYDYSQSVPECEPVDDSYFEDAVFIGDSRTEGFMLYSGIVDTTVYAYKGIMVNEVFTSKVITLNGQSMTIMDAIRATPEFNKVYIMLGMNEMGWIDLSYYKECYAQLIDAIREVNPDAIVYIEAIIPVTQSRSDSDPTFNNPRVEEFNTILRELAEEKEAYYLDLADGLSDETGALPEGEAYDGIHLSVDYCEKWLDYLKNHAIVEE